MVSEQPIQLRLDPPVATIVLNRPARHNALDRTLVKSLREALVDMHGQRNCKALVLTGSGDTFCAGTDLHEVHAAFGAPESMARWYEDTQEFLGLIEALLRFPKPIIAAINGPVIGSGVGLMLAADFIIASQEASVRLPESRLGLSAGVSTPLLSFRVGASAASRMLLSASPVNAEQALQTGLFHELVPPDFVWGRSFEVANQCAAGARESHQMIKQMINETIGESLLTQLSIGAANMAAARTTDAAREGVSAFLEKREPDWDQVRPEG